MFPGDGNSVGQDEKVPGPDGVAAAHQGERPSCCCPARFRMVKAVGFMLGVFYHDIFKKANDDGKSVYCHN